MADPVDHLARIVARKRFEVARRRRRAAFFARIANEQTVPHENAADLLKRKEGKAPHVISEIKLRSPSAGSIRPRVAGEIVAIARGYERGGASAISVLCDGPGFGGAPLDLRRVARSVKVPVLFKEFVVDEVQLDVARSMGASLVLLLVRVLDDAELSGLIDACHRRGLTPVVEAADGEELERALQTQAKVIGINARDLRSFDVDSSAAAGLVNRIPQDRVAVFMSGVRSQQDFDRVSQTRADCVLIGEGLMRAKDPGAQLAAFLQRPV